MWPDYEMAAIKRQVKNHASTLSSLPLPPRRAEILPSLITYSHEQDPPFPGLLSDLARTPHMRHTYKTSTSRFSRKIKNESSPLKQSFPRLVQSNSARTRFRRRVATTPQTTPSCQLESECPLHPGGPKRPSVRMSHVQQTRSPRHRHRRDHRHRYR